MPFLTGYIYHDFEVYKRRNIELTCTILEQHPENIHALFVEGSFGGGGGLKPFSPPVMLLLLLYFVFKIWGF